MKQLSILNIAGIALCVGGISTANGALLESNRQNTTGTSSQPVNHPKDIKYDQYSEYTREQVLAGEARGEILARIRMAREMLADGETVDKVLKYTKLTREEIEALQRGEQLAIEKKLETARATATGSVQ